MLDIILTVFAWRRGWKALALLPMGITFFISLFLGFSEETIGWLFILIIAEIGTLIFMVAKGRKKEEPVVYVAPVVPPVTPAIEPYSPPVKAPPAIVLEPPATLAPVNRAKLVLPDNSEIAINIPVKLIGRTDLEKVVSPDNLKYVSRRHFMINSDSSRYYVEDQNSSNSTKVNGINIKGLGKQELKDGDKIDLADMVGLTFKVNGAF